MKKLLYIALLLVYINSSGQITNWAAQKHNTNFSVYGIMGFSALYGSGTNGYITPITNNLNLPVSHKNNIHANIAVYPNPTQDLTHIQVNSRQKLKSVRIELLSLNGQKLYILDKKNNLNQHTFLTSINLSNLPEGIYLVRIIINKNKAQQQKLIKIPKQ